MTDRPRADPALFAALADSAPKRLVRKLDKQPELADDWTWTEDGGVWTIRTSGEAVVTLRPADGVVATTDDASCDCLLAPRCLHLLAVVSLLEVGDAAPADADAEPTPEPTDDLTPEPAQRAAARQAFDAGARLLQGGAAAAGTLRQSELLRAVHACRLAGAHRAGQAGMRVVAGVRALRAEAPQFALARLTQDLGELLGVSWRLAHQPTIPARLLGTARRAYHPRGSLRVWGLFSEPVIATSGYGGVVTYLCDADGRIWTLSDVMPGDAGRAMGAYDGGVRVGDASLPHRDLARAGLFLQNATGSDDGRLGAGKAVKAVRSAASTLDDEGPAALWQVPLETQLERVGGDRAGDDLLFVDVTVVGVAAGAVLLVTDDGTVLRAIAPTDHAMPCFTENLDVLSRHPGLRLRAIGRVRLSGPRTVALLAVAPLASAADDEPRPALALPDEWGGRCCLGYDRLQGGNISGRGAAVELPFDPTALADEEPDPTEHLRRRVERLALGGRATLPSAALPTIQREAALLDRRLMPTGARVLRDLAHAALARDRATTGALDVADAGTLARAWVAASRYDRAARAALQRQAWAR